MQRDVYRSWQLRAPRSAASLQSHPIILPGLRRVCAMGDASGAIDFIENKLLSFLANKKTLI